MLTALATLILAQPVAVMVHGAGGGGWEYMFWKPVFEKAGYRVVAKDLVPTKDGLAKTTFSDYVDQIVKESGPEPAVLIGASMGGPLVLKAAERLHPKSIVLVCSAYPKGNSTAKPYPAIVKWANGPWKDTVESMPDSDEKTQKLAWPKWRDESGAVLNQLSKGVNPEKPTCPTLSIIPEGDDTVSPAQQQSLAMWANADTIRFKKMSHVGPLLSKRGTEVAELVVAWLKRS